MVKISGKQILWGIPSAVKEAADIVITGIIQEFKISLGGNTAEITDEDGDFVTRVDHGGKNTITIQAIVVGVLDSEADLPAKDEEILADGGTTHPPLLSISNDGRMFVESAEVTYKGNDSTVVSITATHYPLMEEDEPVAP